MSTSTSFNSKSDTTLSSRIIPFLTLYGPLIVLLLSAIALRMVLYTGIVRNDDLDYIHLANSVNEGDFAFSEILETRFGEAKWRVGLFLPAALAFKIFGVSEITTLLYPLLTSLISVVAVYLIANQAAGIKAGYVAALLWAVFPLHVHFATDFMPDLPMTAFVVLAVMFFFRAWNLDNSSTKWLYLLGFSSLLWATLIKPFAIATFLFLIAIVLANWIKRRIIEDIRSNSRKARSRAIIKIGVLLLLAFVSILVYLSLQSLPFLVNLNTTANDALQLLWGNNTNRFDPTQNLYSLFWITTPMLIIAATWLLLNTGLKYHQVLLWALFGFIYMEWGPVRINSTYIPTISLTEVRNHMSLVVPFFIVSGIYLSYLLSKKVALILIPFLGIALPFIAHFMKIYEFQGIAENFLVLAIALSLIGLLFSPAVLSSKNTRVKNIFGSLLLLSISTAALNPSPPDHYTYPLWNTQTNLLEDLKPVSEYLAENPELPILVFSKDMALSLNFVSGMELGYDHFGARKANEGFRIELSDEIISRTDSFFVVHYSDYQGSIPPSWWKVMSSSTPGNHEVYLYRNLSEEDAANLLDQSLSAYRKIPNDVNLLGLFGAALNAGDVERIISIWEPLEATKEQYVSLGDVSPAIFNYIDNNPDHMSQNLFANPDFDDNLFEWITDFVSITIDNSSGYSELNMSNHEPSSDRKELSQFVLLNPNALYYFQIDVQSDAAVNILSFSDLDIEDLITSADIYGTWTTASSIFITPNWDDGPRVIEVKLVEARQPGNIQVRNPILRTAIFEE